MTLKVEVTEDLAACHALRRAVFIEEQGIPEAEEWDDLDAGAVQLLVRNAGAPVASARLLRIDETGKIGRICVLPSHRGRGLGAALVDFGIGYFAGVRGVRRVFLSAQEYAIPFYQKLGFTAKGESYDDAGIPHRDMVLPL